VCVCFVCVLYVVVIIIREQFNKRVSSEE
jgi:hypothetical protein